MPCGDPIADSWAREQREQEIADKIHKLTRMLCETCHTIEHHNNLFDSAISYEHEGVFVHLSDEVQEWWESHKEIDRQRIAQEQKKEQDALDKQAALDKLTEHERNLLNL